MVNYKEIFKLYHSNKIRINYSKLAKEFGISRQAVQQAHKKFLEENNISIVEKNFEYIEYFNSKREKLENIEELNLKLANEIDYFFEEYLEYKDLLKDLSQKQDNESFGKFEAKQKKFIYESKIFIEILKMFHLIKN